MSQGEFLVDSTIVLIVQNASFFFNYIISLLAKYPNSDRINPIAPYICLIEETKYCLMEN